MLGVVHVGWADALGGYLQRLKHRSGVNWHNLEYISIADTFKEDGENLHSFWRCCGYIGLGGGYLGFDAAGASVVNILGGCYFSVDVIT